MNKFVHGIKGGDIVLIPSHSSFEIAFGVVVSSGTFETTIKKNDDFEVCPYRKRKKVKWFDLIRRDKLDPNLYKLMFSQHIITEADLYAEYIDRIANSVFIKDDLAHLVLDVQTTANIKATHLFKMGFELLSTFNEFCVDQELPYSSESVDVKLNLRSPGIIELSGSVVTIIVLGIILVGLAGGKADFKLIGQKVNFESPGILKAVSDFLDKKQRRKVISKIMSELEVKNPEELVKIIGKIENK